MTKLTKLGSMQGFLTVKSVIYSNDGPVLPIEYVKVNSVVLEASASSVLNGSSLSTSKLFDRTKKTLVPITYLYTSESKLGFVNEMSE